MNIRKILVGGIGAAALVLTSLVTTGSAQAAIPPVGVVVGVDGSVTETKKLVDDGGVPYYVSVKWNYKYTAPDGKTRVSVNPLTVYRSDSEVVGAGEPEDAGLDLHFDVSSHGTVRWTQHKVYDGVDLDFAADNQASFNPRNPVSDAEATFVRVRVGTDGDGLGSSDFVSFIQPETLPFNASV